jgi:uncharacterized iron-regulated protein
MNATFMTEYSTVAEKADYIGNLPRTEIPCQEPAPRYRNGRPFQRTIALTTGRISNMRFTHCFALLCLVMTACTPHGLQTTTGADASTHPLSGRIWDTQAQRYITQPELEKKLRTARFVLLGEVHDNAGHHRLQRELVAALLRDGRRPAIAMEQFDRDHQSAVERVRAARTRDSEQIKKAGRFNDKGWNWSWYEPIVRLALDHDLPLLAANLSRTDAFRLSSAGIAAVLDAQTVTALNLNVPLPDAAQRNLEQAIADGHCGKAPPSMLPGIVTAQRTRDALMAQALGRQSAAGAVLIAGNGHVRRDFGVPVYLAQYPGGEDVIAVGLIETRPDEISPADYYGSGSPEYDFISFTPATAREDPCKDIRFKPR